MKRILTMSLAVMLSVIMFAAKEKTVKINILETSDIHGCFFPWDFINKKPMQGTLARVSSYVKKLRAENPDGVVLLENGDILQGQPINYYYNYVALDKVNIAARCINYLKYDAQNWGNHDVETAHGCFDKWVKELNCPTIGANIINTKTGKPYTVPYTIVDRQGVKIAVLGLITPVIPHWLTEDVYEGMRFDNMLESARKWVDHLKKNEHPDLIVALVHSGIEGGIKDGDISENESLELAKKVPGIDVVMFGHDHQTHNSTITNDAGEKVLLINPANTARNLALVTATVTKKKNKLVSKTVEGAVINIIDEAIDEDYMNALSAEIDEVKAWTDRKIGTIAKTITTRDCFFGSSAFTDLVHNLQLSLTKADISLSAPLTFNTTLHKGDITVSDMFKLYKFENKLFVMNLTGKEIRNALEMSYDLWVNTMTSPDDPIMLMSENRLNGNERNGFKNMTFNFDSAAGIDYIVDVTKPDGEKVKILQMSDGQPFDENKMYRVAVNSYRGNGGGELLTRGAGISKEELAKRIVSRTERDQRWYLMQEIQRLSNINPEPNNNWRFVPDEWAVPALKRDRAMIFGEGK